VTIDRRIGDDSSGESNRTACKLSTEMPWDRILQQTSAKVPG
jgi:hypothetical protein